MGILSTILVSLLIWVGTYVLTSWLIIGLRRRSTRLPPGPFPFPIIGNVLQLGQNPNQSLARLSKIYGPLMSLKLGSRLTIVASSASVAKEILQKNDLIFSFRTIPNAVVAVDHHKHSVAWLPPATQWRSLRKLSKEQMFSVQRLDASHGLRQEKLQKLREYLRSCSASGQSVNIADAVFTTSLNLLSNTLFSVDFATYDSNSSQEFKEMVWGVMKVVGTPNLSDYFPVLRIVDLQGIEREAKFYFGKVFHIFDDMISERLMERGSLETYLRKNDLLEGLLDHNAKNESEFNIEDMKHLLLDIFVAGSDTTSATVEWAMTELLRKPELLAKARAEIHQVIGDEEMVHESDISKLPYLQAIVKETFRLHPAAPLLVPHKATANVEINGYIVPKDANILVNVWASGRDSETWSDPETFAPDRFLGSDIDARGQHFELIPFGGGRRICPGLPLAYRMVHLLLATLVHNFDWKLEEGMKREDIDMKENFGLSVQKAMPLKAIPCEVNSKRL